MNPACSLRILHLIAGDLDGGAARGAYWLHRALREIGIESRVLTNSQSNLGDDSVIALGSSPVQRLRFSLLRKLGTLPVLLYPNRSGQLFKTGFSGVDFTRHPAYREANIVHLHWVNDLVRIRVLRKVKKPAVWTLRDMWPLTGGCHYSMGCDRYRLGCGQCPQLGSNETRDLSRWVAKHKRVSLPERLQVVGISRWLSECAAESTIFAGFPVETISNNIDTREFCPEPAAEARRELGLPARRKILLIGAQQVRDFYKGFDLFLAALTELPKEELHVVTFGNDPGISLSDTGAGHTHLGFLSDTRALRLAYSAAHVLVAPSRMDAFGKTLAEAMACGTPVVCFDGTGPRDIVEHQVSGYKAIPFEPSDLARGVQWVLGRAPVEREELRRQARNRAESLFDARAIARQYQALYEKLLSSRTPRLFSSQVPAQ